ncbi:uncharacterized protein RHIMIDRAFT_237897 [Rhizopus microsporus ATCC 52813]|uniref:Uncharacterized protein n=1 Tax=Rhizopus microsporus ATCC 52813 TaxID=1340429 RepID=A0A2G4STJ9_RHIZD|nr:uncharacterized protein RHIMIDRAFT_237897 [Rhizopus microsporus ATCC 52813]PHZ12081.1 hypothetical protein RHIMIDRAFT_237897 [Rhizopus microsporus ATCC 52813]
MSEIQVEEMDLDEDHAFTYDKLMSLTDDTVAFPEMEDDVVPQNVPLASEDSDKGGSVAKHVKACFIPRSTVYEILRQWNESDGTAIPVGCMKRPSKNNRTPKTNNTKLTQKHTQFLIGLVDQNSCITVNMAREQLCNMFQGLIISESGLRKHMKEKIRLSLKNSSIYTMDRNATR